MPISLFVAEMLKINLLWKNPLSLLLLKFFLLFSSKHMTKKQLFGICYVSVWVVIWGTLGSLIDLPFLSSKIYTVGSIGQATTFIVTAFASIAISVWVYPKVLSSRLLIGALGLDTDQDN